MTRGAALAGAIDSPASTAVRKNRADGAADALAAVHTDPEPEMV